MHTYRDRQTSVSAEGAMWQLHDLHLISDPSNSPEKLALLLIYKNNFPSQEESQEERPGGGRALQASKPLNDS